MLTADQFKALLRKRGTTISQWARDNGFKPRDVSLVLNGQIKGNYGKGHTIAVRIGLKASDQSQAA